MSLQYDAKLVATLKGAKPEVLDEISRQSELSLQHSASSALHRDHRNLMVGMAMSATAAAGLAASAAAMGGASASWPLIVGAGVYGVGMTMAGSLAIWQARPADYYTPGNSPESWISDITDGQSLHACKAESAALYQACIDANQKSVAPQRAGMATAFFVALASTIIASVSAVCLAAIG